MCKWGTYKKVRVWLPADLSHTGEPRWANKRIDACIAPIVAALSRAGIHMRGSCCGHDNKGATGAIGLQDGRTILIYRTGQKIPETWRDDD